MNFPHCKIIAFEGLDCSFKETNYKAFSERFKKFFTDAQMYYPPECPKELKLIYQRCNPIICESFPRYNTEFSLFVNQWLQGNYDREMLKEHPDIINTFYALDRFDFWHHFTSTPFGDDIKIRNIDFYQKGGAVFIFDRYTGSNAIYNPVSGDRIGVPDLLHDASAFYSKPLSTEESITNTGKVDLIPPPDIVVFMRMKSFDVLLNSIANKKDKDKNELDKDFLHEIWLRAEQAINRDVYKDAGIKLISIDVLSKNGSFRSRENIAEEVWFKVMGALCN